jgi:ribonuclease R
LARSKQNPASFPSRDDILEFVRDSPGEVGKREIARAFRLDAGQKRTLKKMLREMELDGSLKKGRGRRFSEPGQLPPVAMLIVSALDEDGDLLARPAKWDDDTEPPVIYMASQKRGQEALAPGDRVLARLAPAGEGGYTATPIRRIGNGPTRVLGVFEASAGGGRICLTDRRAKSEMIVRTGDSLGAQSGELVRAEIVAGRKHGLPQARVLERLGSTKEPRAISMIAIHDHELPVEFSKEAVEIADSAGPAPLKGRDDLREIPLVTIDGADARDFDDAVWSEPDDDAKNPGGWHLIVAIADVAWYVRPGGALDRDAYQRGNSAYFPDQVVPMLPETLSNGWCSLVPGEDRSCLAAHLWIDQNGNLRRHRFVRGLMNSTARLTYSQVQDARDGRQDDATAHLTETVIAPLYGAFEALVRNREERGALELELPERRVQLAPDGTVESISERERLDSHKLIEEFMITANVAAAETLEKLKRPCMYRVHDQPSREKTEALAQFLDSIGIRFARGQVAKSSQFNQILKKVSATPHAHMVSQVVLRTQAQAKYSPDNIGHFGLALQRYCHFTSPIRRYADLLVHRALIAGSKLGAGGLKDDALDFTESGEHLSKTERRAALAERSTIDRYTASYLTERIGATFSGRINGVTRFGLFITLDDTGADGLVPIRSLPDDFYDHDEALHLLTGRRSGREYRLGQTVEVMLSEANPLTGGIIFGLLDGGKTASGGPRSGKGGGSPHKNSGTGKPSRKKPRRGRR